MFIQGYVRDVLKYSYGIQAHVVCRMWFGNQGSYGDMMLWSKPLLRGSQHPFMLMSQVQGEA